MTTLLLLALGCGTTAPTTTTPSGAITFPHAEGYDAGALHGPEALQSGELCGGCHRDGSTAPTCASCHDTYPHAAGWLAGDVHGVGLTGEQGAAAREACTACHEGLSAPTCTTCHPSWPHPEGWAEIDRHGAWARSRGSAEAACGSCHGPRLKGTDTAPSCTECHEVYPHPARMTDPAVHAELDQTTCAACHGPVGEGGIAKVACSRCHATFPHPADQRVAHVATAARTGEAPCFACHAPGDGGAPIPSGCALACHGRTP
ncbi:MAG: hypothetical protein KC621_25450 [Myxococcales bacterium]|nr:hypothetical protein [Myxococcales bacterium]